MPKKSAFRILAFSIWARTPIADTSGKCTIGFIMQGDKLEHFFLSLAKCKRQCLENQHSKHLLYYLGSNTDHCHQWEIHNWLHHAKKKKL